MKIIGWATFYRWHETMWMIHHPWSFAVGPIVLVAACLVSKIRNR